MEARFCDLDALASVDLEDLELVKRRRIGGTKTVMRLSSVYLDLGSWNSGIGDPETRRFQIVGISGFWGLRTCFRKLRTANARLKMGLRFRDVGSLSNSDLKTILQVLSLCNPRESRLQGSLLKVLGPEMLRFFCSNCESRMRD